MTALVALQRYLRDTASRGRSTSRVGPFLLTVDEGSDHPYLNYAIPDDGAAPTPEEVAALGAAFSARGRVGRLEYLEPSAPAALAVLEAGGFAVEGRLRAMTAERAAELPVPEGIAWVAPEADADVLRAMLSVQSVAFGGPAEVALGDLERSRERSAAGGHVLAARDEASGLIVAGGIVSPPEGSPFTDIGGIAVAEPFRRRGIASALTAELTRRALCAGARTAFLTPGDDGAARAYERAGFALVGVMLHLRRATTLG